MYLNHYHSAHGRKETAAVLHSYNVNLSVSIIQQRETFDDSIKQFRPTLMSKLEIYRLWEFF